MEETQTEATWPVDKLMPLTSFADWQKFADRLTPSELGRFCNDVTGDRLGFPAPFACYSAVINRLRDLSHMAIDISEEQRKSALDYSRHIFELTKLKFASEPSKVKKLQEAIDSSTDYYCKYASPTMRRLLYDRGLIDRYGAELAPPIEEAAGNR